MEIDFITVSFDKRMKFKLEIACLCVGVHFSFLERRERMEYESGFMNLKRIIRGVYYGRDLGDGRPWGLLMMLSVLKII